MLGYQELPYHVLKAVTQRVQNGTQHFELRQPKLDDKPAYLSLVGRDKQGNEVFDYLLYYSDPAMLTEDWRRLSGSRKVSLSELDWVEKIVDHAVGYGRNGSVTLY